MLRTASLFLVLFRSSGVVDSFMATSGAFKEHEKQRALVKSGFFYIIYRLVGEGHDDTTSKTGRWIWGLMHNLGSASVAQRLLCCFISFDYLINYMKVELYINALNSFLEYCRN